MGRIGREHIRREAVIGVVGDGDRFVLIAIGEDAQHRPEDLFSGDGHIIGDIGEQRGPDEISPEPIGMALAAVNQSRARLDSKMDVALYPFILPRIDQRPDRGGGVAQVPDLRRRHRRFRQGQDGG